MDMAEQKWLVFTSENISIVIPNEFMKMLEKAWKIKGKWAFLWNGNGMKKWFINISDDEKWLIFMIENSLKIMRNGWWKPIYKYNLDLKMTYENKWELKPNYKHKWRLKSTYEYKWIMKMDYKYKWDIFLDYMMKKSWYPYFHENKNPCPEFNGEKMHEHPLSQQK